MTAMPGSIADAPDVLSELLRVVRLTGSVFMNGRFSAPFGVISPARWDGPDHMARLKHASVFHLIAEGECLLEIADGTVFKLVKGDIVLVPFTSEHRVWCGEPRDFGYGPDLLSAASPNSLTSVIHGGGGQVTRLVCGFVESAEFLAAPLFRSLPAIVVERTGGDPVADMLAQTAAEILRQADGATPGSPLLLGRLMELLFIEVLRRYAAQLPPEAEGLLSAMRDPIVARAIHLMHLEPSRKWTMNDLAMEAGSSRSVLAERFNRLLGKPPIEYLTGWRIQLAAERIKSSPDSLAEIAASVGYESDAAFSRAFKREMGQSPGAWRAD